MTTDNRTNEPTAEQVEAAAKAIYSAQRPGGAWCENQQPRWHRKLARAALVAAQGAAPQAESAPLRKALRSAREHFTAIAGSGEIRVWEDTGEKLGIDSQTRGWAKRGEGICREALAAPVLPSSGVDEDALAEEIGRHKLVHVSVSRKSAFCACNPSVTAGVDDNRAWFEGHRARAVAAWLKDGAR